MRNQENKDLNTIKTSTKNRAIAISITEGRVIRDLLDGGLLKLLNDNNINVVIFTPAARVKSFVEQWASANVCIELLKPVEWNTRMQRLHFLRSRIGGVAPKAVKWFSKLETLLTPVDGDYVKLLSNYNVSLLAITHPLHHGEHSLLRAAAELRLPTIGIVRSWDNLYKGLRTRPDVLAVWNRVNADEATKLMWYSRTSVRVIGGTQFDPYFNTKSLPSRTDFFHSLELDVDRPLITLATLGSFLHMYDETYLVDLLLESIQAGEIDGNPQIIIRLHPSSRKEYFEKYMCNPNVRLSYVSEYVPSIGWTMTRAQVVELASIMLHSDVVVSPGSTITIETAIFDTPTIVPIFHTYQPELGERMFSSHLRTHFRRLLEQDLVAIVNSMPELSAGINRALQDRSWYKEQRKKLVEDYITYTDGRSVARLSELMLSMLPRA